MRSDFIGYLTAEGREAMVAHGVRTVIDLRSDSEVSGAQDDRFRRDGEENVRADGVTYLHVPLVDDASMRRLGDATDMYGRYLMMLGRRPHAFRDVFTAIANADGGVLFHCFAGKDRTGLVAAMVLSLAGVPDEHIGADFAATDVQLAEKYEQWIESSEPEARAALRDELRCPPERILAVLGHLSEEWGGVANYLEAAGVTPADVDAVGSRLA